MEVLQVFFPGVTGEPHGSESFVCPPTNCRPLFLTRACLPQLSFVPKNFKNDTLFFSQFWLLFNSKLHQKGYA